MGPGFALVSAIIAASVRLVFSLVFGEFFAGFLSVRRFFSLVFGEFFAGFLSAPYRLIFSFSLVLALVFIICVRTAEGSRVW